jgi:hypothetical protein
MGQSVREMVHADAERESACVPDGALVTVPHPPVQAYIPAWVSAPVCVRVCAYACVRV